MSAEQYTPTLDQLDNSPQEHSIVIVGGGGGGSKMVEGTLNVLESRGMLLPPRYDEDIVVPQNAVGVRVKAVTGGADGGSHTGVAKRWFGDLAMGDDVNILSHTTTDKRARAVVRDRFEAGDREKALYQRGEALAEIAVRNGASRSRVENVVELAVKKSTSMMEGLKIDMEGHRFGVMAMHALNEMHDGNVAQASRELGRWIGARAEVLISSHTPHEIYLDDGRNRDGTLNRIFGEENVDGYPPRNPLNAILGTQAIIQGKEVEVSDEVWTALTGATVIIDAPGSPYASGVAVRAPKGYREAVAEQKRRGGKIIGVSNLVEEKDSRLGLTAAKQARIATTSNGRRYDALVYNEATEGLIDPIIPFTDTKDEFTDVAALPIAADLVDRYFTGESKAGDPIASKRSAAAHNIANVMHTLNENNALPFAFAS